jgi:microcystin-dependent protein
MSQPFIGEIKMGGWNFAPQSFAFCNGALLPISQNSALFALIGTTYGGDGQNTFALPDLRGRVPIHQGTGPGLSPRVMGQPGGSETVVVTTGQLPSHTHAAQGNGRTSVPDPTNNFWGLTDLNRYAATANTPMNASSLQNTGGNQPHDNMLPYLGITFVIALFGIFPSRN